MVVFTFLIFPLLVYISSGAIDSYPVSKGGWSKQSNDVMNNHWKITLIGTDNALCVVQSRKDSKSVIIIINVKHYLNNVCFINENKSGAILVITRLWLCAFIMVHYQSKANMKNRKKIKINKKKMFVFVCPSW